MLRASASQVDLAPPVGSWMTGFGARIVPTTGQHDPIMARAVLLDDGATQLAIVCCDLIGFRPSAVADMRRRIAERSAIPPGNILISCTHTHSGPASMPLRGVMGHIDAAWLASAQDRIVELVAGFPAKTQPARFAHAATSVSGISYNRQDQSHPHDEQLNVIAVETEGGAAIATLINYATHPVTLGPGNLLFSADYPGEVALQLAQARGGIGLFMQGTSGDVDPVVYRDRGWGTGTFDDTREMGQCLVDAAVAALAGAPRTRAVRLSAASRTLAIPVDQPPEPARLEREVAGFQAEREAAASAQPRKLMEQWIAEAMLDWAGDLSTAMQDGTLPASVPAELFVAAINDVRIVGVPFETYSDIGLNIKRELHAEHLRVMFAGYANGLYGYCPARWAKDQGGYGPDSSARWFPQLLTPVGYGADELIIREAVALAQSL
jgi:neutral ceramidase